MSEQNYGIRLTAETGSFTGPTDKATEAQKRLKEEIQGVAKASREAGDESAKFVQKLREEIDAVSRAKRESEEVAALRKRINDQREQEIARVDASRTAQAALTREIEQGTTAMRAGAAEALALAAGHSTLRGAVTALIGSFMGPAGIVATLATAAAGWMSFGRAAEDAGEKAAAAAKKVADTLSPRMAAQQSAAAHGLAIQGIAAQIRDLEQKKGMSHSDEYRAGLDDQIRILEMQRQIRVSEIQRVMGAWPDQGMTLDEARKGLRSPSSARRDFDERVRNLYDVYGREISGGGSPEYVASMQGELVEQYGAAKRQYDSTLASFAPRGGRGGGGGGADVDQTRVDVLVKQATDMVAVTQAQLEGTEKLTQAEQLRAKVQKDLEAGLLDREKVERAGLIATLDTAAALQRSAVERERDRKAAEEATKAYNAGLEQQWRSVAAIEKNNEALAQHNREIGLNKSGVDAMKASTGELTLALLENERAMLGYKDDEDPYVRILDARIDAQRRFVELLREGAVKEASAESARRAQEEWKRSATVIEHSLADALMRGFDSGKDWGRNFVDTLKNMFKTLILEPIIRPVAQAGAAAVLGTMGLPAFAGGGGGGGGGGLGLLSNASSIGNLFSGGSMLQTVADFGNFFGSIGSITEAGSTFGVMDAIGGFAMSNPWTAVAAIAAPFVLDGLFGGGGGPKTGEILLQRQGGQNWMDNNLDSTGRSFVVGSNNLPGGSESWNSQIWGLIPDLNNPAKYDQEMLSQYVGTTISGMDVPQMIQQLLQTIAPAALSAQQKTAAKLAPLSNAGVLAASLRGWVDSQAVSEYLSPEEQLSGAQSLYDTALAKARGGDVDAARGLTGYADRLIGAGRGVYASSEPFHQLRADVYSEMSGVLKDQGAASAQLMADIPVSVREGAAETVKAVDKMRAEVVKKLEDMASALRQGGLGGAPA